MMLRRRIGVLVDPLLLIRPLFWLLLLSPGIVVVPGSIAVGAFQSPLPSSSLSQSKSKVLPPRGWFATTNTDATPQHNAEQETQHHHQQQTEGSAHFLPTRSGFVRQRSDRSCCQPRRFFLREQVVAAAAGATVAAGGATTGALLRPAAATAAEFQGGKSRTAGYALQHTEREWSYLLSGAQYNILRLGGTERQASSVLNTYTAEDQVGTYRCAGCVTPLFASTAKFNSGTGWPSFAAAIDTNVEVERANPITATFNGREVRCGTCGGHLGDLFNDGWIYIGTTAAKTGKRYCIDGAALIFRPTTTPVATGGGTGTTNTHEDENNNSSSSNSNTTSNDVYGDQPPPNKVIKYEPTMFRDKSINAR